MPPRSTVYNDFHGDDTHQKSVATKKLKIGGFKKCNFFKNAFLVFLALKLPLSGKADNHHIHALCINFFKCAFFNFK